MVGPPRRPLALLLAMALPAAAWAGSMVLPTSEQPSDQLPTQVTCSLKSLLPLKTDSFVTMELPIGDGEPFKGVMGAFYPLDGQGQPFLFKAVRHTLTIQFQRTPVLGEGWLFLPGYRPLRTTFTVEDDGRIACVDEPLIVERGATSCVLTALDTEGEPLSGLALDVCGGITQTDSDGMAVAVGSPSDPGMRPSRLDGWHSQFARQVRALDIAGDIPALELTFERRPAGGIGIIVGLELEGEVWIDQVFPDTPGAKAGLQEGDRILGFLKAGPGSAPDAGTWVTAEGLTILHFKHSRRLAGDEVTLSVQSGSDPPREVTLPVARIDIPLPEYEDTESTNGSGPFGDVDSALLTAFKVRL